MNSSGKTTFVVEGNPRTFGFAVSVVDEKIKVWLEDDVSKHQWEASELTMRSFGDDSMLLPNATVVDYAHRFAECLHANKDGGDSADWIMCASFSTSVVHMINLTSVHLDASAIVSAQLRDVIRDLEALKQSVQANASAIHELSKPEPKGESK